jgi:hypothetical protein
MRLVAIFMASSKTWRRNVAGHGGGTLGNKMTNTFPLFFSKLNRTSGHVNMPGGCALSALSKQTDRLKLKKTRVQNCVQTTVPFIPLYAIFLKHAPPQFHTLSQVICTQSPVAKPSQENSVKPLFGCASAVSSSGYVSTVVCLP